METVISNRITKFVGIEFEKKLDILINNEQKRIEELQLMRNELCELWKANFLKKFYFFNEKIKTHNYLIYFL